MKILMLSPEFVPVWGGIGSYTYNLVRSLPRECEIHVLTSNRKFEDEESEKIMSGLPRNVTVHRVTNATDTFVFNLLFQLKCRKNLRRLDDKNHFDIFHTQSSMPDLMVNTYKLKAPLVTTVHTTVKEQLHALRAGAAFTNLEASEKMNLLLGSSLNMVESFYYKGRDNIITVSDWYKRRLLTHSDFEGKEISVIHNGVDIEKYSHTNTDYAISDKIDRSKIKILFFSRMLQRKGIYIILDSMRELQRKYDVQFIFAGTGDVRIPDQRGVVKLGYIPEKDKVELYSACDIFVLPSLHENMPISILEAMACGKPCVASNVGGIPEIITDGLDGILCEPNVAEFSNKVSGLIEDDNFRKSVSVNARKTIEDRFTISVTAKKTYEYYQRLVEKEKGER